MTTFLGFFARRSTALTPLVVYGQSIPKVGTVKLDTGGTAFDDKGDFAYTENDITGGAFTGAALIKKGNKALKPIAKQGAVAPGTGGAVFSFFDLICLNSKGDAAFSASYTSDGGMSFHWGVFLARTGKPATPVALDGATITGPGGGTLVLDGNPQGVSVNDKGDVAFVVSPGSCTAYAGSALLKPSGKPLQLAAHIGDALGVMGA